MATTISSLREGVRDVADSMEEISGHAKSVQASFSHLLGAFIATKGASYLFGDAARRFFDTQPLVIGIKTAINSLQTGRSEAVNRITKIKEDLALAVLAGTAAEEDYQKKLLKTAEAQLELRDMFENMSKTAKIWAFTIVSGLLQARILSARFNQDLIEANSELSYRFGLMQKTLEVQRLTGVSFAEATEAARALVHHSMDTRDTFKDNVKYVTMLKEGVGVSTQTSAKLAVIWEGQLNQSFREAADLMAQIVNSTSLAGEEAGQLAENIARAVGAMRPGVSADMSAVVKMVAGYEDQLKRLGGQAGGFGELLTKMTGTEGLVGAGLLGVGSPEFLASEKASEEVIKRFGSYIKSFLGQTQGWERQVRLEQLSELFGLSAHQINLMAQAVANNTAGIQDNISVEQRYREQMVATGQSLSMLVNKFRALLTEAMLPALYVFTKLIDIITQVVGWLAEWKLAVIALQAVLVIAIPFVIRELYNLARVLVHVALSARAAALARIATTGGAVGTAASSVARAGFLAGLRTMIVGVVSALGVTVTVGLVAVIGVLAYAAHLWRQTGQLMKEAQEGELKAAQNLKELAEAKMLKFYLAARTGDEARAKTMMETALTTIQRGYNPLTKEVLTDLDVARKKAEMIPLFTDLAQRAKVTQILSEKSFATAPEEITREYKQEDILQETARLHRRLIEVFEEINRTTTRESEERTRHEIMMEQRDPRDAMIQKLIPDPDASINALQ